MENIKALVFDVFGTTVDWRSTVIEELAKLGQEHGLDHHDWEKFADHWRSEYMLNTKRIAEGGKGPSNVDVMHRQILDEMLQSDEWTKLGAGWDGDVRTELNLVWHRLKGWPDSVRGLEALRKHVINAALSNGNMRLLIDMAKHANLPWDVIFSTELFFTFKPNPKAYQEALRHLDLEPANCAMVASHLFDLRAAAKVGMTTVYVRRSSEDIDIQEGVRSKRDGGEVDFVVDSFVELAELVSQARIGLQ